MARALQTWGASAVMEAQGLETLRQDLVRYLMEKARVFNPDLYSN